jgi:hypothetical protein
MTRVLVLALLLSVLAAGLPPAGEAHAVQHIVTNANDTGAGTLRMAIAEASNGDIITFDPVFFATPKTISLGTPLGNLLHSVTIYGPGKDKLTIDASGCTAPCSVFRMINSYSNPLKKVTITNMTLTGASAAAVRAEQTDVTLASVAITGNSSSGVYGFAGILTIMDSTIANNHTRGHGGGIWREYGGLQLLRSTVSGNSAQNGGGIYSISAGVGAFDSTISSNQALKGGGIYHVDNSAFGISATVRNSAVYNNGATLANGGSQFYISPGGSDGTFHIENSIVGQGPTGNLPLCTLFGSSVNTMSLGTNIFSDSSCMAVFPPQPSDRHDTNPQLGPLASNGGPTRTHLPLPGSPAIDTGADCGTTDQRSLPRPADGSTAIPGAVCDVGPVEVQPAGR